MTTFEPSQPSQRAPGILRPFDTGPVSKLERRLNRWLTPALVGFCMIYGFAFALFGAFLPLPFLVPPVVLLLLVIWALPDARRAPTGTLGFLFLAFYVGLVMWPDYLAIALPGAPWITVERLTGVPMVLVLLICVSTSKLFRTTSKEILNSVPAIWKLLVAFSVIQFLSLGLSKEIGYSVDKFIVAQTSWTAVFFASVYLFREKGRIEAWAALLWAMAIALGLIAVWEFHLGHVPWAGHTPSFLQIDSPDVQRILAGQRRAALGVYRAQATFSTSLGLAEFMALTAPFVLHFALGRYRWLIRAAAAVSISFFFFVVGLSGSRLGMVGFFLAGLLYTLFWALKRWRTDKRSLWGPAIGLSYPAIFCMAIAASLVVHRIRVAVWGNGAEDASTQDRVDQYNKGLPMVLHNPLGHGIGMAATTLGDMTDDGTLTIDTYYLSVLLEYGVIGFAIYYGMFALGVFKAGKLAVYSDAQDGEMSFALPLAISLANFIVIKSVFSQQDNHPLVFMMLGMVVALVYRANKMRGSATDSIAPSSP